MEKAAKSRKDAKEDKSKDKTEDQILKSLEANATIEEKFQELLRKHADSEREARRFRQELKAHEKQLDTVTRERENLQKELNRSLIIRNKFTEVAREQQKMIKSLKNESMLKLREEEERRKESQYQFQTSLNEIAQSLTKNNEENLKLRDYNIEMTKKLKYLAEQYQTREQQLEKLNEQVELESQIHQAKLSKVQVEAAMEKEILTKEKQIALEKLLHTQTLIKDMSEREQELKQQLNLYTTKYDDFQSSLQKSNNIFSTYKVELEKMSKNTRKLEKEALDWKRKFEKSNATLIELATEKKERDEHAIRCNKQVEQLQKLLRALQNERSHLYKCIRDNNIECPPVPQLPPEPEPLKPQSIAIAGEKDKMEMMTKNCAELKQTLASLQDQMKFLTCADGTTAGATTSKTEQIKQQQEEALLKKRLKRQKQRATKLNKITLDRNTGEPSLSRVATNVNTEATAVNTTKDTTPTRTLTAVSNEHSIEDDASLSHDNNNENNLGNDNANADEVDVNENDNANADEVDVNENDNANADEVDVNENDNANADEVDVIENDGANSNPNANDNANLNGNVYANENGNVDSNDSNAAAASPILDNNVIEQVDVPATDILAVKNLVEPVTADVAVAEKLPLLDNDIVMADPAVASTESVSN